MADAAHQPLALPNPTTSTEGLVTVASMNAQISRLKTIMQKSIDMLEQQSVDDAALIHQLQVERDQAKAELAQEREVINPALRAEIARLRGNDPTTPVDQEQHS